MSCPCARHFIHCSGLIQPRKCSIKVVRSFLMIMLPQSNVRNASGQLRILKGCNIPRKKILEDKQTLKYVFNPCHSMDSPNDIATISIM